MADNTILQANVELKIDTSTIDKQISNATKKIETGLSKADQKLSKQLTKQIDRDLGKVGRQFERGADKLSKGLEKGLKIGVGAGTAALYAFLKSGTPEALRFANSLDKVKMAWAKVGQTLATKINFRGRNLTEWADVVANKIENLDTKQIEKLVGYFKLMAIAWGTIKIAQGGNQLVQFATTIASAFAKIKAFTGIGEATSAATGASAATTAAATGLGAALGVKRFKPAYGNPTDMFDAYKRGGIEDLNKYANQIITNNRLARTQNLIRGGAFGLSAAYGGYNIASAIGNKQLSSRERQSQISGSVAGISVAALGTALAGPLGTALGYAVGEGINKLGETIADAIVQPLTFSIKETNPFKKSIEALKGSELFGKQLTSTGNAFVGGNVPLEERKKLLPGAISTFNTQTEALKGLERLPLTDTVKAQIAELNKARDAIKQFIDGTIELSENQTEAQKSFAEQMADFDDRIKEAKIKSAKEESKGQKALNEITNPEQPPKGGAISTGAIEDLPSILSQAINDQANQEAERLFELQQQTKDIAEKTLELQEAKEEREKELAELEKQRAKEQKEYEAAQLKASQTTNDRLKPLVGGSSTVLNM